MRNKHEIWGIEEGQHGDYYVEGWSRLAGWFCMELENWNQVLDQLRTLGFEDREIFKAKDER